MERLRMWFRRRARRRGIRGVAVALAADGKESVANELLDAAQYVECGYVRGKALREQETETPSEKDAEDDVARDGKACFRTNR